MACGDFKSLPRRLTFDNVLCDKAFNFAKDLKYGGYQRSLALMVYSLFDKVLAGTSNHAVIGIN